MKQFETIIEYGSISATMSSQSTLEEAKQKIKSDIDYYKGINQNIREAKIVAYCDKCNNNGEYRIRRPRSIKTVKCECNKQYANEVYEFILV